MEETTFDILYEDDDFVAINKPTEILVHRTKISEDTVFVLQLLRNQLNQRIYPVHRLDRATSGVLIFGKDKEAAGFLGEQFRTQKVEKKYLAVIRGHVEEKGNIDYALTSEKSNVKQEAISSYIRLDQTEMNFEVNRYPTSRYSLVEITPLTGRTHQIRKHFAHIRHPIIGDKRHGDNKHNNYFTKVLKMNRMLLHAFSFSFQLPTQIDMKIEAPLNDAFKEALSILQLNLECNS